MVVSLKRYGEALTRIFKVCLIERGDRSYEGGAMWSVSSRYEALSREQKIIDILQDNGQRNCCLGLHEQ